MIIVGLALTAIIYPLIQGRAAGWPAWTFVMLGAGALLLGAFVMWERRHHGDPLIEPALLANRTYTSGILVALAFFGAFSGVLLCVSLFVQLGEGFSPIHAGLTLTAMVVGMIVGMGASFALVARLGRHLLHVGIALVGAGAVVLALTVTGAHTASALDLAPGLFLFGAGAGMAMGSCSTSSSPASVENSSSRPAGAACRQISRPGPAADGATSAGPCTARHAETTAGAVRWSPAAAALRSADARRRHR